MVCIMKDLPEDFSMYVGIIEHEENSDVVHQNSQAHAVCMIKNVEEVSIHLLNSKNSDLCNRVACWGFIGHYCVFNY